MSEVFSHEGCGCHSGLPTPARLPTLCSVGEGQVQHRKGRSLGLMREALDVEPGTRVLNSRPQTLARSLRQVTWLGRGPPFPFPFKEVRGLADSQL